MKLGKEIVELTTSGDLGPNGDITMKAERILPRKIVPVFDDRKLKKFQERLFGHISIRLSSNILSMPPIDEYSK